MQSAVDPDNSLAFARQRMRLLVGQPLGVGTPGRDVLIMIELLYILGRRDDHHVLPPALFGRPDIDQLAAVAFGSDFMPVLIELRIARHHVVVADVEAQKFLGCSYFWGSLRQADGGGEEKDSERSYLH